MLPADDAKAEEARRLAEKKRDAYFAELEKESSTAKGKRSKKGAAKDPAAKPAAKPLGGCLLYTSPSPRDRQKSRMPSSA